MLALIVHLVFMTVFVSNNPGYNWDFLAYIGLSVPAEHRDPETMHETAYGLMQERLNEEQFSLLVAAPESARDLYENPDHFASHLEMFKIKPLYILLVRTATALGVNPIDALLWMSLLPGLLICVLAFHWLRGHMSAGSSVAIVVLFSICSRLLDVSRVAFPDALSALMLLAGIWCLLQRKWITAGSIIWVLSIWVRTTNILYVAPVMLLFCWNDYCRLPRPVLANLLGSTRFLCCATGLVLSIISYFWINIRYDYSWWLLFYHSFIELQSDISEFNEPFSFDLYFAEVIFRTKQLVTLMPGNPSFPTIRLPMFLLILFIAMGRGEWIRAPLNIVRPYRDVSLAEAALFCLPVFVAFLLLFPQILILDRFFVPFYAIIILFASSRILAPKANSETIAQ